MFIVQRKMFPKYTVCMIILMVETNRIRMNRREILIIQSQTKKTVLEPFLKLISNRQEVHMEIQVTLNKRAYKKKACPLSSPPVLPTVSQMYALMGHSP